MNVKYVRLKREWKILAPNGSLTNAELLIEGYKICFVSKTMSPKGKFMKTMYIYSTYLYIVYI